MMIFTQRQILFLAKQFFFSLVTHKAHINLKNAFKKEQKPELAMHSFKIFSSYITSHTSPFLSVSLNHLFTPASDCIFPKPTLVYAYSG